MESHNVLQPRPQGLSSSRSKQGKKRDPGDELELSYVNLFFLVLVFLSCYKCGFVIIYCVSILIC